MQAKEKERIVREGQKTRDARPMITESFNKIFITYIL